MAQTFHVQLRALEPEDLPVLWNWHQKNEAWDSPMFLRQMDCIEQVKEWLHNVVYHSGRDLTVGITETGSRELLGLVSLYHRDMHHRQAGLEVWPVEEGPKGYGAEAVLLLLNHAFVVLGLERVEARVRSDDDVGLARLYGIGFVHEAHLRKALKGSDGRIDVEILSMLSFEFRQRLIQWQWPYPPKDQ